MRAILITIIINVTISVYGQVSVTLPATLANVTHDYSNSDVIATNDPTTLNSVKLSARSLDFRGVINLNNSKIKAERMSFNSLKIHLNNSNLITSKIVFTQVANVTIEVQGDIKIICDDIDSGPAGRNITIIRNTLGGSLTIEYKGRFNRENFVIQGDIDVSFIKK
jgi:hypothetical protein